MTSPGQSRRAGPGRAAPGPGGRPPSGAEPRRVAGTRRTVALIVALLVLAAGSAVVILVR